MIPALLATLPIAPGLESVYMLPKFILLAAYLCLQRRGWRKMPAGVNWGVGIYLATQVLSACFAVIPTLSWLGVFRDHSTGIAADLLLVSLFYLKLPEKSLIRGLQVAGALVVLSFALHLHGNAFGGRAYGLVGGPVYAGAVLAICAPHMPALWLAILLTGSRGAFGAGSVALALRYHSLTRRLASYLGPVMIAYFVIFSGGAVIYGYNPNLSDSGRLALYKTAIAAWRHMPILGHGPSTFVQAIHAHNQGWQLRRSKESKTLVTQSHAHNWFFELIASSGLVGLAGFLAMLFLVGREMQGNIALWASLVAGAIISFVNPLGLPAKALMALCAGALIRREDA